MRALGMATMAAAMVIAASAPRVAGAEPRRQLRVCADPHNLPFSDEKEEGLENALAKLVARALDADLQYTWLPQRRGFVRNTLKAKRCDVMMEAPAGYGRAATTTPYYRSTYVFVTRKDRKLDVRSFDDPVLRKLRIGVQIVGDDYANPPPAAALARRGLGANVVGYSVYGDYSTAAPLSPIMDAVADGKIDVAVVWGPIAGWFAQRARVPLVLTPTPALDAGGLPLTFDIGMGVRRGDEALLHELDGVIKSRRREIDAILRRYGVPLASR